MDQDLNEKIQEAYERNVLENNKKAFGKKVGDIKKRLKDMNAGVLNSVLVGLSDEQMDALHYIIKKAKV